MDNLPKLAEKYALDFLEDLGGNQIPLEVVEKAFKAGFIAAMNIRNSIIPQDAEIKVEHWPDLDSKCTCDQMSEGNTHSCPYACEINDNDDPEFCNCCPYCEHNCAQDI